MKYAINLNLTPYQATLLIRSLQHSIANLDVGQSTDAMEARILQKLLDQVSRRALDHTEVEAVFARL